MANKLYIISLDGLELSFTKNSIGYKAMKQLISEGVQPEFLSSSCILQYIANYVTKKLPQLQKLKYPVFKNTVWLNSQHLPQIVNN